MTTVDVRFWSKVDKSAGPGDCWMWTGAPHGKGYGGASLNGHAQVAHRVAYQLAVGPIPAGLWVLHSCDNRRCCNPVHLWLGTHQDNMDDMVAKGRGANAATHHPRVECPSGHAYTVENTRVFRRKRYCRECDRLRNLANRARARQVVR